MSNFSFLKPIDKDLYNIISDAEKLYRDEYFEQCIGQTRRFGENVCKKVLGNSLTCEKSFDEMLATLKDKVSTVIQEKEFVEDLYFLKREGNKSVHASNVQQNGMIALECLQRAFEVAINYAVHYKKSNSEILNLEFDIDLLITGKKSKQSLAEKYSQEKKKVKIEHKKQTKPVKKNTKTSLNKNNKKINLFLIIWFITAIISFTLCFTIFLIGFKN